MTTDTVRVGVIVNPVAAGGRGLRLLPRIVEALEAVGEPHHVHVTNQPGEATSVARRFAGDRLRLVLSVGGDGTANEVANGLLAASPSHQTALGVIPAGRGADFARMLSYPAGIAAVTAHICRAAPALVDTGLARFADGSTRAFINVGGLGFDSMVAIHSARSRLPGDKAPYLHGVASAALRYRNVPMTVDADGRTFGGRMLAVIVANGQYFGGGFRIVPMASLNDGFLNLAILGDISRRDLLRQVPRVYRGTHVDHPKFTQLAACAIEVDCSVPMRVQLDGELAGPAPVTFTAQPSSLWVAGG